MREKTRESKLKEKECIINLYASSLEYCMCCI